MPDQKKVISISTARKKVMGQIEVDGVAHDVHQLDFDTNQRLQETNGTSAYLSVVRQGVRTLCPTLSDEQVGRMGIEDGGKIVIFAGGGAKAVEGAFPNEHGDPETPTSPA